MENLYTTNILEYRYHLQADEFGQDPDEIFLSKLKKEIDIIDKENDLYSKTFFKIKFCKW